ncbi:MAG: WD40/YVTN/BNR-like repeat-containing protein [Halobacteriales archaeon]
MSRELMGQPPDTMGMSLYIGTNDGLYRASDVPFEDAERVLACGRVAQVRTFPAVDGVLAATETGLYRSTDGEHWRSLELPRTPAWSVLVTDDGTYYAGTAPAHLYRSVDGGDSWTELDSLQAQPSRPAWTSPVDDDARLRTIGASPDTGLIAVGIEAGKLHISQDDGRTWTEQPQLPDDIHHVLVVEPTDLVVSTGFLGLDGRDPGGLYRTTHAGDSWRRLDSDTDRSYFRETIDHDGRLFVAAAGNSPGAWREAAGPDAALYELVDGGLQTMAYPGEPDEVVIAWAVADRGVVAGTAAGPAGRVLLCSETDDWRSVGTVPTDVRSLAWR